jgi:hypothetical protein
MSSLQYSGGSHLQPAIWNNFQKGQEQVKEARVSFVTFSAPPRFAAFSSFLLPIMLASKKIFEERERVNCMLPFSLFSSSVFICGLKLDKIADHYAETESTALVVSTVHLHVLSRHA